MIPVLKNRLEEIINKFSEIESQLSDNEIDINIRMSLSKEHAELSPVVLSINELKDCQKEIEGVQEILNDKDTDQLLREEALKEFDNLKNDLERLNQKTQKLLIPKDPDDNRDAILEIRAGTGGDEAALFGNNLLKMYSRYAEIQKWNIEVLSLSENDIGGCKEASINILSCTDKCTTYYEKYAPYNSSTNDNYDFHLLEAGQSFVLARTAATNTTIENNQDGQYQYLYFSGNDAIALVKEEAGFTAQSFKTDSSVYTVIDVVGELTTGATATTWSVCGVSAATKDKTLVKVIILNTRPRKSAKAYKNMKSGFKK